MTEFEEEYFKKRRFEDKHYKEAMMWIDHFNLNEKSKVFDYGCGLGFYSHALRYLGIDDVTGYEISNYACANSYGLMKNRISNYIKIEKEYFDFILCYDVLEHIKEEEVNHLVNSLYSLLKPNGHVLFSICFKGNPLFKKDKSHKTEKPRAWWEYWIEQVGFKIESIPDYFWWRHQAIIARK